MNTRTLVRLFVATSIVVCSLVLATSLALACPTCGAPDKVTISGPHLNGPIEITDPKLTQRLGMDQFFGFERRTPIAAPKVDPNNGYNLTRQWEFGIDHLRYYPSAKGEHGYFFYSDDSVNIARRLNLEQRVGKWFVATTSEDSVMQQLLSALKAAPASNADRGLHADKPAASTANAKTAVSMPSTTETSTPWAAWLIGLAASAVVVAGGWIALRRRA